MLRRALLGFLLFLACGLLVSVAAGEEFIAGQPVDGVYYFTDIGIPPEQLVVSMDGYQEIEGRMTVVRTRPLKTHEYSAVETPKGIIGFDIHLDKAIDATPYALTSFTLTTPPGTSSGDGRIYYVSANSYQFVPKKLYLYSMQTKGLPEQAIDHFQSSISDSRANISMYMQTLRIRPRAGTVNCMDDSDIFYFVGADIVTISMDHSEQNGAGEVDIRYFLVERNLRSLDVGESITIPLNGQTKGETRKVSATFTKVAVLRGETPSLPKPEVVSAPIVWPEDAIGRIVVTGSGVNVREGGSTSYKVVHKVNRGDSFFVLDKDPSGWYALSLPDGRVAYISPKMVEFTPR